VFFAPSALKPPKAPTMKYWKTLLLVSLPERYFLKLGMTVVSFLPLVPRVKGELNSACEVEASARVRLCCCTARGARAAGRVWREAWRATTVERRVGIDMAAASMGVCVDDWAGTRRTLMRLCYSPALSIPPSGSAGGNADWVPADWLCATARATQLRNHDAFL